MHFAQRLAAFRTVPEYSLDVPRRGEKVPDRSAHLFACDACGVYEIDGSTRRLLGAPVFRDEAYVQLTVRRIKEANAKGFLLRCPDGALIKNPPRLERQTEEAVNAPVVV